jgi:hypothetical protein
MYFNHLKKNKVEIIIENSARTLKKTPHIFIKKNLLVNTV